MYELNKKAILEWVEALESGEYQQTTGTLAKYVQGRFAPVAYCCLGVACDVFKNRLGLEVVDMVEGETQFFTFNDYDDQMPPKVYEFLGLTSGDPIVRSDDGNPRSLSNLNDEYNKTFPEIAAIIRANFLEEETSD